MFICLLFFITQLVPSTPLKRDLSFDSQVAFTNTTNLIWQSFWNQQQQQISSVSSCSNSTTFSQPVVWDLAVSAKAIINTQDVNRTNLIIDNLYKYENDQGWFSSTPNASSIYTDDNAQVLWCFLDAYHSTQNTRYLNTAKQLMTNIQSQWSSRGGILWQINSTYIASISTTEAALSAVKLYEFYRDDTLLDFAFDCMNWLDLNLKDPQDGFFYDGINVENGSTPNRGKLTYTVGTAISTYTYLWQYNYRNSSSWLNSAIDLAAKSLSSPTFLTNGNWNNQVQYIHLLFCGFGDLIQIGGQTSFKNQVLDQGNYYHSSYPVSFQLPCQGNSGTLLYDGSMAQIFYQLNRINDQT